VVTAVLLAHQRRQKAVVIPDSTTAASGNGWKRRGWREQLR
jgi:hypothetical protein